jgi:hypothetical protein
MPENDVSMLTTRVADALNASNTQGALTAAALAAAEIDKRFDAVGAIMRTLAKKAGVTAEDVEWPFAGDGAKQSEIDWNESVRSEISRFLSEP